MIPTRARAMALVLVFTAAACTNGAAPSSTTPGTPVTSAASPASTSPATSPATAATDPSTTDPSTTAPSLEVPHDIGVSPGPCPDSPNPDNACIYVGVISDLSEGPLAEHAVALTEAQIDFWAAVNAEGGLDGFDVAITPEAIVDARSDSGEHVAGYAGISPSVAALAQTFGTSQTRAVLPDLVAGSTVAVPTTRWSGWSFDDVDGGVILEAGAPYCLESMNGFDFVISAREGAPFTYAVAIPPGADGADYAAGVRIAAAANGFDAPLVAVEVVPFAAGGDATISEAIDQLVAAAPEVVFLATGPRETATIMAGVYQGGHQTALYVGAASSWDAGLLSQEALVPLLEASFFVTSPWAGWAADSPGHERMRAAAHAGGRTPSTGYLAGWVLQYNLLAVLERAIEEGDLTREGGGLLAAAAEVEDVDYEGMLPPRSFAGTPDEVVPRQIIVNRIDATSPDGTVPAAPFFVGSTASAFDFEAPCASG